MAAMVDKFHNTAEESKADQKATATAANQFTIMQSPLACCIRWDG